MRAVTDSNPDVSIIIVTHLSPDEIPSLQRLREQSLNGVEVIVRQDEGISVARNAGIGEARSDKLVFIDDDALPHEGFVTAVTAALEHHPVVTGRVLQPSSDIRPKNTELYDRGTEPISVDKVIGCNMGFQRRVFDRVGQFDEAYGWGHEEWELSDRIREEFPIRYDPSMVVTHPFAESRVEFWRKEYRRGISEVHYWRTQGLTTAKLVKRCAPVMKLQDSTTDNIGKILEIIGHWRGLIRHTLTERRRSKN